LRLLHADAVLIVDPSAVANPPLRIEHKHFWGADGAEQVGDAVVGVLEDRETQVMLPSEAADVAQLVVLVGVDAEDGHTPAGVIAADLVEAAGVEFDQRAIDAEEGDDDELTVPPVAEPTFGAAVVAQGEIGDGGAGRQRS